MNSLEVLDTDLRHLTDDAHGLAPGIYYVMTFLDATDGSVRWMPRRAYHPDATRSIYLPEGPRDADFVLSPDAKLAYAGPIKVCTTDGLRVTAPDGSSRLEAAGSALTWTETDLVDLTGTAVGPACRLALDDPALPLLYTTRPYRVVGEVKNVPVTGAALLVTIHLPDGADLLASPLLSRLQIAWIEFVNEFSDGTYESGLLVHGREGLTGIAVSRSDGTTLATADVTVTVQNDGDFPQRLAFTHHDETLTWDALPRGGRWPVRPDIPDGYRFRQGEVHGAERPAVSYAFAETFQDRM